MAFYQREALEKMGFKHLGENVKISDKASIYNHDLISVGDNSRIDDFCVLSGNITIGRNVHIAVFCNMAGGELGITMEDFRDWPMAFMYLPNLTITPDRA
jgi:galactoside O-acetyltransferase